MSVGWIPCKLVNRVLIRLIDLSVWHVVEHFYLAISADFVVDSAPVDSLFKRSSNRQKRIDRLQRNRDHDLAEDAVGFGWLSAQFFNGANV